MYDRRGAFAFLAVFVFVGLAAVAPPSAFAQVCTGDCNDDHRVVVSELVTGVNIALRSTAVDPCRNMDADNNGSVAVNELVAAVNSLLRGCPATFTPSNTATPTITPTFTRTFTPTNAGTATDTPTATATPTVTNTGTQTFTPSNTPTITPTATPTATFAPPRLIVRVSPDPAAPGQTLFVSLTVSNSRLVNLTNTVVRAIIPANNVAAVTRGYIAAGGNCPSNSCTPGATITWNLGVIPAGAARTVSFPLTILSGASAPADGTVITVEGSVSAENASTVNANDSTTVDATPPLALSIDTDKDVVAPGETLRYSVYFGNQSVAAQNDTSLSLDLPPGVTVQSISDGGQQASGVVAWELGNLAAGASGVREVLVQVAGDVIDGSALLATSTLQSASDEAQSSIVNHVDSDNALVLTVDANPDPIAPGETMVVSMTVTNRSLVDLTNVVQAFAVPAFTTGIDPAFANRILSCRQGASFGCDVGERVFWTIGTLAAGHGLTLTFPITVTINQAAPPPGSVIVFNADVVADGGLDTRTNRTVAVRATRALDLEIDPNPQPVANGAELEYVLSFGNRGLSALPGAILHMPLPEGTTFESASDDGTFADGVVTWTLGDLAVGESGIRRLVVNVAGTTPEGEPLRADATLVTGTITARASAVTQVETSVPLTMRIDVNPDPVEPGEGLITKLTVTNRSATTLFAISASVRIPGEVNAGDPAFATEGLSCRSGASFGCNNFELAVWTVGDLPAGASKTLSLPLIVPTGQTAPPSGTVISFDGYAIANNGADAYAEHSVLVRTTRDLDFQIDASPEPAFAGNELRYSLAFGNIGVGVVSDASVEFPIPEGTAFVSASGDGVLVGTTVTWDLGDLPAGASGVLELVVGVDEEDAVPPGTTIVASATLQGGDVEARTGTTTPVGFEIPMTISVAASPDPIGTGEAMLVSVLVTNNSPITLFEIVGLVRVPPETSGVTPAFTNNGGVQCRVGASFGCDPFEFIVWTVGDLAPGQGALLTLPSVVLTGQNAPPSGSVITWEATASANNGTQVTGQRSLLVRVNRPLDLELDAIPQSVGAGADITYTVNYGNRGVGTLAQAVLDIPLPANTTFKSASDGGLNVAGLVTWAIGDLPAGSSGSRELVVTVDDTTVGGTPIAARAILAAVGAEARADALTRVQDDVPLTVTLTAGPDPISQGQNLSLVLTVTNDGPVALFGVAANLRVPPEVSAFSPTDGGQCRSGPSFSCDNLELERWAVGSPTAGFAPGASTTFNITVPVPMGVNAPPDGTVITFEADALADGGLQTYVRTSVRVQ